MPDQETSSQDTTGLEGALARVERAVEASGKAVASLARELKRARAAAASGQVRELRRALDAVQAMAGDVVARVGAAATAYDVDEADMLASGAYAKELLAAAEAADVAMFTDDDRLLCYPSIVRVVPGDVALEIDRKRARGIRPSVVVAQLAKAQRAGPRFKPAPFLASLVGAYDLVVAGQGKAPGAVVRLLDVYNALTLLPGQSRDYTRAEFARDLYLLDQSGETAGPGGRRLRWAASSGTRQAGVLTTVAISGQQQRYWGIAVDSGHSERLVNEIRGSLPAGGIGLGPEEYAEFVAKEYLGDYVRAGGAAVRFVVAGSDEVAMRWHHNLASIADAEGYLCVGVDAADHRVHLIDQLFAAVARQVDWCDLARRQVRAGWESLGLPPPAPDELAVATVAAHHDVAVPEAARSMRRHLESVLLRDPSLDREFRLAVLRLCQCELGTGDVLDTERDAVLAWLRVEPVALRLLKSASLYGRVARHNARALLVSLAAWRARVTGSGLVLDIDLSRLAVARRPPLEQRAGHYYSKAAVLDAYEVLRQLVDATDNLRGAFVAVTMPPELVTDDTRGLPAYSALHLRVIDEIRDRRRANPFAALVRLETRLEVVR